MHASVMTYVAWVVDNWRVAKSTSYVLEVGSYDENGSVREIFEKGHCFIYTGVDMRPGPGVDVVATADQLPWLGADFDVVVSTEMLEHDIRPWASVREMARVLKPGGHIILTARGFHQKGCFAYHAYPHDHWRYSVEGLRALMEDCGGLEVLDCRWDPEAPGVFALGRKP